MGQSVGCVGNLTTLSGTRFEKAEIKRSSVMEVVQYGEKIRVNNYHDKKYKYFISEYSKIKFSA